MTKLKSAEIWSNQIISLSERLSTIEVIQLIQQNAIEAALEVAARKAKIKVDYKPLGYNSGYIDKQSITSLINHPNLKL